MKKYLAIPKFTNSDKCDFADVISDNIAIGGGCFVSIHNQGKDNIVKFPTFDLNNIIRNIWIITNDLLIYSPKDFKLLKGIYCLAQKIYKNDVFEISQDCFIGDGEYGHICPNSCFIELSNIFYIDKTILRIINDSVLYYKKEKIYTYIVAII
jgi:hypothetical protein